MQANISKCQGHERVVLLHIEPVSIDLLRRFGDVDYALERRGTRSTLQVHRDHFGVVKGRPSAKYFGDGVRVSNVLFGSHNHVLGNRD